MHRYFQFGAWAAAGICYGILPGYAVFVGSSQHDLDVRHPHLLPGNHLTGQLSVYFKDQSSLLFSEKHAALYFKWDLAGAGGLCSVSFAGPGGAARRRAGIPKEPGPVCPLPVRWI